MIKKFKAGRLNVCVYEDRKQMGYAAAAEVAGKIKALLLKKEFVNVIFAAAPSQSELLAGLVASDVDWSRVNAFHMDEYIGLPDDAPQRFGSFLAHHLFDRVACRNVFYINGSASDLTSECKRYSDLLQAYPADIVCLGIGENGHLAFNDPPVANFNDPETVKIVTLDDVCRQQQVNDGCFNNIRLVPLRAITLTIPTLMRAPNIFCVVPGQSKAKAVYNTIFEKIITDCPSSILRNHENAILFLDRQSSSLL